MAKYKVEDFKKRITEGGEPIYGLLGSSALVDKVKKAGGYTPETEAQSRRGLNQWTMRGEKKADRELNITPGDKNFSITPKQKPVKVVKKEVSVEATPDSMPTGDIGSVNRIGNPEAIGPDMSKTNMPAVADAVKSKVIDSDRSTWIDPMDQARAMLQPKPFGYKKGGSVKAKAKSSAPKASSASRRGDGIALRGKTKGRLV